MSTQEEEEQRRKKKLLSPWQKYRRYNIFPTEMSLHVIMIVLLTSLLMIMNEHFALYARAMGRNWVYLFYPEDYTDYQTSQNQEMEYYIFTINKTYEDAQRLVDVYYDLPQTAVSELYVYDNGQDQEYNTRSRHIEEPKLTMYLKNDEQEKYTLFNSSSGWPFSSQEQASSSTFDKRDLFNRIEKLEFKFTVKSYGWGEDVELSSDDNSVCLLWEVFYRYSLGSHGQFFVQSYYHPREKCHDDEFSFSVMYLLACLIFLTALIHMGVLVNGKGRVLYNRWRRRREQRRRSSMEVSLLEHTGDGDFFEQASKFTEAETYEQKLQYDEVTLLSSWHIVYLLCLLLCIIFSAMIVFNPSTVINSMGMKWLMGLSGLIAWACLAQYLYFVKGFYVLVLTVAKAFPKVMKFLVGILPFFIGYALFGMVLFGDESDLFGDIVQTCVTLFAVVNGDEVLSTFENLSFMGSWGQLYLVFFTLLFTYVILMSIIAIVEEAFFSSTTMVSDLKQREEEERLQASEVISSFHSSPESERPSLHRAARKSVQERDLQELAEVLMSKKGEGKSGEEEREEILRILKAHLD